MVPRKSKHPKKPKALTVVEKPDITHDPAELRRRAEARLGDRLSDEKADAGAPRVFHELEVHQIELEMQNAELHRARNELEAAVESYTDLYDFAPVGYCSIDESGAILEANLTGASLLGIARSRLINRRLPLLVSAASRPVFMTFLEQVFTDSKLQTCEALLNKEGGGSFWAGFRATSAASVRGTGKWCRVAFDDISSRKQAEEAKRLLEAMTDTNLGLNQEIARRQKVEKALQKSEQHQVRLLEQSHRMQAQLRHLSHRILYAQEEERKRISRELHDQIAQTLVGINVHLVALTRGNAGDDGGLRKKIAQTQRLVEKSVETVHRFARELRPTVLDDLGLTPALHAYMKEFTKRTGVRARLSVFAEIEQINSDKRTILYRVAQEALTNVARHAEATRVNVKIQKTSDSIRMTITDDGRAFQVRRVMSSGASKHLGLLGMRERLEMVGGAFSVESAPRKGTTVTAQIPSGKARARNQPALK